MRLAFALIFGAATPSVFGLPFTWTGTGGNLNWSTGGNWNTGGAPTSGADLTFAGTTNTGTLAAPINQDLGTPFVLSSLTFASGSGSFFLGGGAFQFNTGATITQSSSNTVNIANAIGTPNSKPTTLTLTGNGTGILTLGGVISSGSGGRDYVLTKSGTSTFALTGANTYGGGTTIDGGTLAINSINSLGTGALTINAGTLEVTTGFSTTRIISLGNTASTLQIDPSQTYTVTTAIAGTGALNKTGTGTLVLSGANTYSGGTTISAGTLQLGASERLVNTSPVTVSGGTFDLQGFTETVSAVTISSGSIIGSGSLSSSSFALQSGTDSAILAGSGATLTKTTAGTVTLTAVNTLTGATTVSGGTLTLAGSSGSALGSTSSVTVNSGGTVLLGANNQINNTAPMTLAGGTFAKGAFNEGSASTPGVGALTLTAAGSHLDFSTGAVGVLTFASFAPGAFTLTIDNWTGTPNTMGSISTDRLVFNSDQSANLSSFSFTGYLGAVEFSLGLGYYEIVPAAPVPETSTWVAAAMALGTVGFHFLRRRPTARRSLDRAAGPFRAERF